jgi:cysteine desulfurase
MAGPPAAPPALRAYLDGNATGLMSQPALDALVAWCNRGSPGGAHAGARAARRMLAAFRREIAAECGFELEGPDAYDIIFTAGAADGSCLLLEGAVRAYAARTRRQPHVLMSAAEHEAVQACCRRLVAERLCQLTILPVARAGAELGSVAAADLAAALRPNTCLASVLAADGETGALNDLRALAAAARRGRVPFHTDAAQLFGRGALRPAALGLDAFTASFHRLGGAPGVGVLVVRRALVDGYGLGPGANGAGALVGAPRGAPNLPGLGACLAAFRLASGARAKYAERARRLRDAIQAALAARVPCFHVDDHPADRPPSIDGGSTPPGPAHAGSAAARRAIAAAEAGGEPAIFWVMPAEPRRVLPNTLLLAVRRPGFSAAAARAVLEERGVTVGVGGARAAALGVPAALRGGLVRLSLAGDTTADEARAFVREFLAVARRAPR